MSKSSKGGHNLTRADSIKGGKKSKRGASIKTRWEKLLESDVPKQIRKALADKVIIVNGQPVKMSISAMGKNTGDALALVVLTEALSGQQWAAKLIVEQIDGKALQPTDNRHTGEIIVNIDGDLLDAKNR